MTNKKLSSDIYQLLYNLNIIITIYNKPIVLVDFPKQYNSLYLVRLSDNIERI